VVAALATVALTAVLAACTGSSGRSSSGGTTFGTARAAPAKVAAGSSVGTQPDDAVAKPVSTAQIRTADLSVAVAGSAHVAAQADAADAIAERAGGEVTADDRTSGKHATAELQLRVPPAALLPTLSALAKLGTEKSRRLSTTDVTERVADVNSRVASARSAIARLRTLYAHAVKVADVIAIEQELSSRESDLESLEAQQRALLAQTSMATIALSLVTAAVPPVVRKHHHAGGFVGGLQRGWDGFTAAAAGVATGIGAALPFLLVLLVVALAVRLLWSRLPRRQHRPESGPLPE
jgi:hypothetical protein